MTTATLVHWKPGTDLPYVLSLGDGRMLAIALDAAWLKPDRAGNPLLLPPALRALDQLRAVFANQTQLTPGFIASLREGMGLTQSEFAQKLGVSKMTISRWECARMRPSRAAGDAILALQAQARREGVKIDVQQSSTIRSGAAQ
jgi:DNA-binding transcriptional regulator YiaG